MAVRVSTLGKSAIINRQLNSAYDIVEFVADNLPLLIESCHKIQLIANIDYVKDHVDRTDIHLSEQDRQRIETLLNQENVQQSVYASEVAQIHSILNELSEAIGLYSEHISNQNIHVSDEDRELLTRLATAPEVISQLQEVTSNHTEAINTLQQQITGILSDELSDVAYSGSYNDLTDKPVIDNALSDESVNAVQNKVLTQALGEKASTRALKQVAFTGSFNDLSNKPVIDNRVTSTGTNAVSGKAVYDLIGDLTDGSIASITFENGTAYITHLDGTVTTETYVYTDRISEDEIDALFQE